jgi:hypothetical protein
MLLVMPLLAVGCSITVFSETLLLKSIGYFMQGLFHIKVMNSYTHIFDLVPEDSKRFCATFMNVFDSMTLFVVGIMMKYVTDDLVGFIEKIYIVSTIAVILYILFIPESP